MEEVVEINGRKFKVRTGTGRGSESDEPVPLSRMETETRKPETNNIVIPADHSNVARLVRGFKLELGRSRYATGTVQKGLPMRNVHSPFDGELSKRGWRMQSLGKSGAWHVWTHMESLLPRDVAWVFADTTLMMRLRFSGTAELASLISKLTDGTFDAAEHLRAEREASGQN